MPVMPKAAARILLPAAVLFVYCGANIAFLLFCKYAHHEHRAEAEAVLKHLGFGEAIKLVAIVHHLVEKLLLLLLIPLK